MDITWDWVSSFVMLFQAFTLDFSCCLFVGLSAFSFVLSKWNTCSIRVISGDSLGHCRIFHFLSSKTLAFTLHFGSSSICTMKCRPINFAESISLYTSESNRLRLYSVISSLNTSNSVPQEAMHAHAFTLLHHVSQMMLYALDHELFQAFSKSFFLWFAVFYKNINLHMVKNILWNLYLLYL